MSTRSFPRSEAALLARLKTLQVTGGNQAIGNQQIVYHSGYGHTARMATAIATGAGSGATLVAIDADGNIADNAWENLADADAIVLGSPTYMGGPSWQFKKFADASSKPWFEG